MRKTNKKSIKFGFLGILTIFTFVLIFAPFNRASAQSCTGAGCNDSWGSSNSNIDDNQAPNVTISADQTNVPYGGNTIIRWYSTNATFCYGSGGSNGWNTTQLAYANHYFSTGPLTSTTIYTIFCSNYDSIYSDNAAVVVTVGNPNNQTTTNNFLTVVTTEATQVSDESVQLNSLISSSATSPINAWFEWGPTINLGNTTTITAVGTLSSVIHTDTLSGLSPGTTYYYQAYTQDSSQNSYGSILSFTTGGAQNPTMMVTKDENKTTPSSPALTTSSVDNTKPNTGEGSNHTLLGAFVLGSGFFPGNIFGWLLLIILILLLILLAKYL